MQKKIGPPPAAARPGAFAAAAACSVASPPPSHGGSRAPRLVWVGKTWDFWGKTWLVV